MTAMTVATVATEIAETFEMPVVHDFDGTPLLLGDVVVETVMTGDGVACPKMSAKPEMFTVYMYGQDVLTTAKDGDLTDSALLWAIMAFESCASQLVLIRSVKSGKYYLYPASVLCWVKSYDWYE